MVAEQAHSVFVSDASMRLLELSLCLYVALFICVSVVCNNWKKVLP